MDAFGNCREVEARAWLAIEPVIAKCSYGDYRPMFSNFKAQRDGYDVEATLGGAGKRLELKAEEDARHGNFFLETWSNKHWARSKPGWMLTFKADWLLYYFVAEAHLFWIPSQPLVQWFFGDINRRPGWMDFPEKPQSRHKQKNMTTGCCVPIETIWKKVGFKEMFVTSDDTVFRMGRDYDKKAAA